MMKEDSPSSWEAIDSIMTCHSKMLVLSHETFWNMCSNYLVTDVQSIAFEIHVPVIFPLAASRRETNKLFKPLIVF